MGQQLGTEEGIMVIVPSAHFRERLIYARFCCFTLPVVHPHGGAFAILGSYSYISIVQQQPQLSNPPGLEPLNHYSSYCHFLLSAQFFLHDGLVQAPLIACLQYCNSRPQSLH